MAILAQFRLHFALLDNQRLVNDIVYVLPTEAAPQSDRQAVLGARCIPQARPAGTHVPATEAKHKLLWLNETVGSPAIDPVASVGALRRR